jgi:hypothetical protein
MTANGSSSASPIGATTTVTLSNGGGIVFVPASAPLIGLNYYDGRFLRADDLNLERQGQRAYAEYSNQAGGPGLVYGFDLTWQDTQLSLSPGLAVDPKGGLIYLPDAVNAQIADLITASQPQTGATAPPAATSSAGFGPCAQAAATAGPGTSVVGGTELYLVCVSRAQELCGQSEVFGRICDDACVSATDRPYVVDGVALLLLSLKLQHPLPTLPGVTRPEVHLRSQVASAFFADEWDQGGSLLSASGLGTQVWCAGATPATAGDVVPVGVLGWDGTAVTLLDEWTARRERIETPPRAYWAGRMELRPWPVFLAQVLQFQCQLAGLGQLTTTSTQVLLDGGIVELPSAGYLPVTIASGAALRTQLQGLLGGGVDLRFCAVRRDQIAHELERAQHMNRISLIRGLSNRADQELVDILVPDGLLETDTAQTDYGFAVDLAVGPNASSTTSTTETAADLNRLLMQGIGRVTPDGGLTVRAAVAGSASAALGDMAGLVGRVGRSETGLAEALAELHRLGFGSGVAAAGLLRDVGQLMVRRGIAQRTEGPAAVLNVTDASADVVAVGVSGWVALDPFTMTDGSYAAFHLGFDLIVVAGETMSVKFSADGRLQRLWGRVGDAGLEVRISVTGFAQASMSYGTETGSWSASFTQAMVLHHAQLGGNNVIGLSDDQTTWIMSVGWHGDPIQATGSVLLKTSDQGQHLTSDTLIENAFTLALGGIGRQASPPPTGYEAIAALDAAQQTSINQPGNPHREAAISALQLLSGLYPEDATYVERGYGELFPPAPALPSRVQPTTDWVLFRRRRREDCEGTVEPPQPGTSKLAAWVAHATSVDDAKQMTSDLFDSGGATIQWQPPEGVSLEFEGGAATLLTTPSAWQNRYSAVGGGKVIYSAGYASSPGASDAPTGVGRAQALIDASAPAATPDPNGRVDLVGTPPPNQMQGGTDGSIFLITYRPDRVDVFTVDATDNKDLPAAIRDHPDLAAVAGAGPAVSLLASVDVVGGLRPSASELRSELDKRQKAIVTSSGTPVAVSAVVWTYYALSGERRAQSQDHISRVLSALNLSAGATQDFDFVPGSGAPGRILVMFERGPGQVS